MNTDHMPDFISKGKRYLFPDGQTTQQHHVNGYTLRLVDTGASFAVTIELSEQDVHRGIVVASEHEVLCTFWETLHGQQAEHLAKTFYADVLERLRENERRRVSVLI